MRSALIFTILVSQLSLNLANAGESCLRYAPEKVTLLGKLQRFTFPGRPNYESVADGDEPETGFYLELPQAICINGDKSSVDAYPQENVKLVQLILDSNEYSMLRSSLGTQVTLRGTLFAKHTAHHHAPLLLQSIIK